MGSKFSLIEAAKLYVAKHEASDNEVILEVDDFQPEPLKIKSYNKALSELNYVTDFFTAPGESQLYFPGLSVCDFGKY